MIVRFCFDGEVIYTCDVNDVAGIIAAVKESKEIYFGQDIYHLASIALNHYTDEDNQLRQELMIYLDRIDKDLLLANIDKREGL